MSFRRVQGAAVGQDEEAGARWGGEEFGFEDGGAPCGEYVDGVAGLGAGWVVVEDYEGGC